MALLLLTNRVLIRHLPQHSKNLSLSEEQTNSEPTDAENESPSSAVETDQADMMENTILVAYFFRCWNHGTDSAAGSADLYEIIPYTEVDLAYLHGWPG